MNKSEELRRIWCETAGREKGVLMFTDHQKEKGYPK